MNSDKVRKWVGQQFARPTPESEARRKKHLMDTLNITSDEYEKIQQEIDEEKYINENNKVTQQEIDEAKKNLEHRGYTFGDE